MAIMVNRAVLAHRLFTAIRAIKEIRALLAERGCAVPERPGLRLRTLADVFAYAQVEGVVLRLDATEVQVRQPAAGRGGRRAFVSGKKKQNHRLRASRTVIATGESELHGQTNEVQGTRCGPTHIRVTWDGTGSVEDASRAFGFSRAKGYDLVRRGEFPCRVLRIGRDAHAVTASLLRVLETGEPEFNGALAGRWTPS
ncbi:hypothetical protein [Streptomyces atratus]|uniref:hypothetical protein n=1 Tax=Streptomyces atratus TaxID=1893 RepID=UPI003F69897E